MPDAAQLPFPSTTPNAGEPMPETETPATPNAGEPMPEPETPAAPDPAVPTEAATPDPVVPAPDATAPRESEGETTPEDDESTADTQRMLTPEDAARATLTGVACELGHDEVRVLARIAERLRGGREAYGPLALATDARDFRGKEAREEIEDALVYLACAWLKAESHTEVN